MSADEHTPATAAVDDEPVAVSEGEFRSSKAKSLIKNYVIASMGISLVPVPILDLLGLTGTQLKMLHSLANLYDVPFSKNMGKSLIAALTGSVMPTSTALTLASFAKVVPGLGTATGMASVAILGGGATYAIGSVFMQHFESGGTLLDFEPKKMRTFFASKLKEGKQVASKLQKSQDGAA